MSARIIVFDHSPNLLKLFQAILTNKGYQVVTFQHEAACLEVIKPLRPDLLILGNLRGYDDDELDVIYELKSHIEFQSLPVVISTTANEFTLNGIASVDGIYVLPKPFDAQILLQCIESALG